MNALSPSFQYFYQSLDSQTTALSALTTMYKDVFSSLAEIIKDCVVCEICCGNGECLAAMKPIAKQVFGVEKGVFCLWHAIRKRVKIIVSDCYIDPLPSADVYLIRIRPTTSVYFLIHKLLSNREFHGTIIIMGDASDNKQQMIARHCARIGGHRKIEVNTFGSNENTGVFDVVVIKTDKFSGRASKEKRAVISLAIGKRVKSLRKVVEPIHNLYAKRIGADHIVIEKPRVNAGMVHFEKFQIYECLEQYDRVAYIDLDAIPRPDCPDLFELVPSECVGVSFESVFFKKHATGIMQKMMEVYHKIDWHGDYFNSGVIVASKQHREIFSYDIEVPEDVDFPEQTMLNYRVARDGHQVFELGDVFNFHSKKFGNTHSQLPIYIAHFAGRHRNRVHLAKELSNKWYKQHSIERDQSKIFQFNLIYGSQVLAARDVDIVELNRGGFCITYMEMEVPLNRLDFEIFKLCDGYHSVTNIIQIMSQTYSGKLRIIRDDVVRTLKDFLQIGIVYGKNQFIDDRSFIDIWQTRFESK
jgi:2'-5' RNA ligase